MRTGLVSVLVGIVGIAVGLWTGGDFLAFGIACLLAPAFGVGFFLMAGLEVRRLKRELEEVDDRLRLAKHGGDPAEVEALKAPDGLAGKATEAPVERKELDS
jgi:hypothetical protein